jgi:hypothetical protein
LPSKLGLPDLANKNTRHSIKFEFQINYKTSHAIFETWSEKQNIHCFSEIQIELGCCMFSGIPATRDKET